MARYFRLIEIERDEFVEATGEDLDCYQLTCERNGVIYIAASEEADELEIDLFDDDDDEEDY